MPTPQRIMKQTSRHWNNERFRIYYYVDTDGTIVIEDIEGRTQLSSDTLDSEMVEMWQEELQKQVSDPFPPDRVSLGRIKPPHPRPIVASDDCSAHD